MSNWLYNDKWIKSIEDFPENIFGFIYITTHKSSGKSYLGKKSLYHNVKKKLTKKEVKGHESSMHKMKKGGIVEKGTGEKYKSKAAMMKHEKKETKAEEMKEHGMKKGGMCGGKYARGGGIEKKGKTKGRII